MTYAPARLKELAAYWIAQGGVNLGIVGDTDHQAKGQSYHLGRDQLSPGAYSIERPRDKAGLTNAASAIDLGRLGGSYKGLRAFSDWAARLAVKGHPLTVDIVEIIYSPDGQRVLGYKQGVDFLIPNYGDLSHLTHTHFSFFRDSEFRSKLALFKLYFEEMSVRPGDDFNYGWEKYTLDGSSTVYCIGGPRNPDGSSDPTMRLCAAGPTSKILTVVSRDRLTDGVVVTDSDELWAATTAGSMPAGDNLQSVAIAVNGVIQKVTEIKV